MWRFLVCCFCVFAFILQAGFSSSTGALYLSIFRSVGCQDSVTLDPIRAKMQPVLRLIGILVSVFFINPGYVAAFSNSILFCRLGNYPNWACNSSIDRPSLFCPAWSILDMLPRGNRINPSNDGNGFRRTGPVRMPSIIGSLCTWVPLYQERASELLWV